MRRFLSSVAALGLLTAGCASLGDDEVVLRPNEAGEIVINMDEFTFGTDRIEVPVGQTVTFILVNAGENEHEFMIGRNLQETSVGYPNGFEHDFFEDVTPVVDPPNAGMDMGAMDGMSMGSMTDGSMTDDNMSDGTMTDGTMTDDNMSDGTMTDGTMTDDNMSDGTMTDGSMSGMDMGGEAGEDVHSGFMVQRRPGEVARLTVTVPEDAVGTWQVGCFRGRGSHWDAGMRTTLVVVSS